MPAEEVFTPPTHHLGTARVSLYRNTAHLRHILTLFYPVNVSPHRAELDVVAADQFLARLLAAEARVPG